MAVNPAMQKVDRFISRLKKDHADSSLDQLKSASVKKMAKRYSGKKSSNGGIINFSEALDLWEEIFLKNPSSSISKNQIKDVICLVSSKQTGIKAKRVLLIRTISWIEMTFPEKIATKQSSSLVEEASQCLSVFAGAKFKGFISRHGDREVAYLPSNYKQLASAVKSGEVSFTMVDKLENKGGVYNSNANSIKLKSKKKGSWGPIMIHESTHAIQDLNNVGGSVGDWEVAAYVSQALYHIMVLKNLPTGKQLCAQKAVIDTAKRIAGSDKIVTISADEHKSILEPISKHPLYKDKFNNSKSQNIFDPRNFLDAWIQIKHS